jgi:hypothetical protein
VATGLKCAPPAWMNTKMRTARPIAVARELTSSRSAPSRVSRQRRCPTRRRPRRAGRPGELGQQPPGHHGAHRSGVLTSTRATPVGASQVPTMLAAISVRSSGSHNKIASTRARGQQRSHRGGAGRDSVLLAIGRHDHDLELAVLAVAARDPVGVQHLDLAGLLAGTRHGDYLAGLTARMIAECMPGAASWVKVTDASVNPAAVSPPRYSARDRAPAMQPT